MNSQFSETKATTVSITNATKIAVAVPVAPSEPFASEGVTMDDCDDDFFEDGNYEDENYPDDDDVDFASMESTLIGEGLGVGGGGGGGMSEKGLSKLLNVSNMSHSTTNTVTAMQHLEQKVSG